MPRVSEEKRNELEAFWRAHIQGWCDSALNQREYCKAHGLPLKRYGSWRAELRGEVPRVAGKLLYRRGGGSEPMRSGEDSSYIPSRRPGDAGRRRNFGTADKRLIVEETVQAGASVGILTFRSAVPPAVDLYGLARDFR